MAAEGGTNYVFSSLYTFSEAAKHEVMEKYKNSSTGQNCIVEFTDDDRFLIRCGKDDPNPLPGFVQLIKEFITLELEKEVDMTEDVKLERRAETQTEIELDEDDLLLIDDSASKDLQQDFEEQIFENALIQHENFSRIWRATPINESVDSKSKLSEKMLKVIGSLTNCRAELEPGGNTVILKGDSSEEIEKAILKLEVVHSWMSLRSTAPLTFNFQYSEGMPDILLEMLPLREIEDRRLQTTLILPQDPLVKHLGHYLTVVMRHKGAIILSNQSGRPSSYSAIKECSLWKGFSFKSYGDNGARIPQNEQFSTASSSDFTLPSQSLDHPTVRTVQQWVKQTASKAVGNPFSPNPTIDEPPAPTNEEAPQPELPPIPARKRHVKTRKPLGREVVATNVPELNAPDSKNSSTTSTATTSLKKNSAINESDTTNHEKSSSGSSDDSNSRGNESLNITGSQGEKAISKGQPQIPNKIKPPPIEEPYMPAEPKSNSLMDETDTNPNWQRQSVLNPRIGRLIDTAVPDTRIQETVQMKSELETRTFKETMNQKKPASFTGSSSSLSTLLASFEMAIRRILEVARKLQGPLDFSIEIGRILIKPQSGLSEHKKKQFSPSQWSSVFSLKNDADKPETTFTNMLTTTPIDAQFIMNLKTSSGSKMFVEEPVERKVSYHFECNNSAGDSILVKVDDDGLFTIRLNEYAMGFLNLHFPKRFWDARLRMKSSEPVSDGIYEAAQELVKNLRICPSQDGKSFDLDTMIDGGHLQIQSVFLCRRTAHRSVRYPGVLLHLSEMQDLRVWQPTGPKGPYEASLQPSKNIISNGGKSWWEASLSSVAATENLKANEEMELGSLSGWTPEDILKKNTAKELFDVTQDVVTNIDSVGYYNRGPKGNSGTKASEKDKRNEKEFW